MYSVTASFKTESRKIEGSWPIDMYVLNSSLSGVDYTYYVDGNQDVVGFQLDSNGDLTVTETTYTGLPIKRGSISTNTEGEIPSIDVSIPNTDRAIESIIQANNYLRGCSIHILSTFARYLPSGSTAAHIGTTADKNNVIKEKIYIDGVSSNEEVVTFSCKPKFTVRNVVLPGRRYGRECQTDYGPASIASVCRVAQSVYEIYPTCGYTLASCQERMNATRFIGFPSVPRKGLILL